jgi:uncharacterized protein (DUF433 family)
MPGTETTYEHIILDDRDVPIIEGTTMKVIELVGAALVYSWSPAELQDQFPYLTLGQIHSALAYYWDHQAVLDQDMEQRLQQVEELRRHAGQSPLRARLKEQGLL